MRSSPRSSSSRRLPALFVALLVTAATRHSAQAVEAGPDDLPPPDPAIARLVELPADNVRGALDDPARPVADRDRDARENLEAILRIAGVARGMRVADLRAGEGTFAQVLPSAVRRFGKVWANNDPASLDAATAAAWKKRLENPSTADISRVDKPLASPLPPWATSLDLVFLRDGYHDAIARGVDRAAMNGAVFQALSPGGRYVVVDARAADAASADEAARLCRVGEAAVRAEIEAAGFRFVESNHALHAAGDDRATSACDVPASKPLPDRLLLVFEKPKG